MWSQLPALSPVEGKDLIGAAWVGLVSPERARQRLEMLLTETFGAERALLTGSGTQALDVALRMARDATGVGTLRVALPGYTCYDVVSAAVGAGAEPVFYDLDPVTLMPDLDSVGRRLAEGAKVVVGCALYGFPVDWNRLRELCRESGALLVEDSAQGIGGRWEGQGAGSFGDLTVFSFGRGKGWTGGGGGALLVRGGPLAPVATPRLLSPSRTAGGKALIGACAAWLLGTPRLYGLPSSIPALGLGRTIYHPPTDPFSIGGFSAALACRTAQRSSEAAASRRALAERWFVELADVDGLERCRPTDGAWPGYLRYPILWSRGPVSARQRDIARRAGMRRGYPCSIADLPVVNARGWTPIGLELRGSRRLARELWTLPTHHQVTDRDFEAVRQVVTVH